ncbi:MAG: hypothetical protein QM808_00880 [Steroidobacteraceae bacterium]
MRTKSLLCACVVLGAVAAPAWALDASGQRYAQMLASGGPGTISSAAQDIFNTGMKDPEVLDLAAQVLVDLGPKTLLSGEFADSASWLCKALGISGNGRYKAVLESMSKANINKKTKKWCEKSADQLPKGAADSFVAGSVNVDSYKDGGKGATVAAAKPAPAAAAKAAPASGKPVDFSLVKEGMSQAEVDDLLPAPTAQSTRMTGKQFQPFNFGAKDLQRLKYLYKGVGHIEFSMKSGYNGVFRVIAIVPDANETGYP